MSNKTIEYTPKDENDARGDYYKLRGRKSHLKKKIKNEKHLLKITPKENEVLKRDCLENLIVFKVELKETKNEFKSIKGWFKKTIYRVLGLEKNRHKKNRSENSVY